VKLTIQIPNGKPAQTIYLNQIAGSVSYDANTGALIIQDLHGMGFTPDSRVKFALSGTQGIFAEKKKPEKEYREAQYQYTQTSTVKGRAPKKTGTK
jgi:hypothetical protein